MIKNIGLATLGIIMMASVAMAAPKPDSVITVPDAVYGGTTVATVDAVPPARNATDNYVLAQCWASDDGEYLYAGYFSIADGESVLGPFATGSTWTQPEPADCRAAVGYFTRQGFGKWVETGSTNFFVFAEGFTSLSAIKMKPSETIPFIDVAESSVLFHGGYVEFISTYEGPKPFEQIYVTVVCSQDTVVYQWSDDPSFSFPLVQQEGLAALGLFIDTTQPMACEAWLIKRANHGSNVELAVLDIETFMVQA